MAQNQLERALGWFSLGLGLAQVAAPKRLGRLVGAGGHDNLMRVLGLREISAGMGILSGRNRAPWMWSRVGGDLIDLSLLAAALKSSQTRRGFWETALNRRASTRQRLVAATGAVAAVTALDLWSARRLQRTGESESLLQEPETLRLPVESATQTDFARGSVYFVGTATVILRYAGFTILTDPNFLHQGDHVHLGYGMTSERLTEPALDITELPPVDFVVLSHYHGDHFDRIAEARLDKRLPIITTNHAAAALRAKGFTAARGLETWETLTVTKGAARVRLTSLPGKHGPGAINFLLPPVMGSMLEFDAPSGRIPLRLYITGDTLLHDELREVPRRFPDIDLALLHLGGTRILGVMLTMDAKQGVEMIRLANPRKAVPIHYNDYTVFKSPLADFVRAVEEAGLSDRVVYLNHGEAYDFEIPATRWQ